MCSVSGRGETHGRIWPEEQFSRSEAGVAVSARVGPVGWQKVEMTGRFALPLFAVSGMTANARNRYAGAWLQGVRYNKVMMVKRPKRFGAPSTLDVSNAIHQPEAVDENKEFVRASYVGMLNRDADPYGLENFSRRLDDGALSKSDVVRAFLRSEEFRQKYRPPGTSA
jgi:hypothetical protein